MLVGSAVVVYVPVVGATVVASIVAVDVGVSFVGDSVIISTAYAVLVVGVSVCSFISVGTSVFGVSITVAVEVDNDKSIVFDISLLGEIVASLSTGAGVSVIWSVAAAPVGV